MVPDATIFMKTPPKCRLQSELYLSTIGKHLLVDIHIDYIRNKEVIFHPHVPI